jgi:predicted RNA binding protein YcfA (HicA-like mRNA interferase family)
VSSRLLVVSGAELVKAPTRAGFEPVRQRGSHVSLLHEDASSNVRFTEIKRGTLSSILTQAELSREELTVLLKGESRRFGFERPYG